MAQFSPPASPDDSPENAETEPAPAVFGLSLGCACHVPCSPLSAARCLYSSTLEGLAHGRNGGDLHRRLLGPLATAVAAMRTRQGHSLCAEFADALDKADPAGALEACRRLIEFCHSERPGGAVEAI